MIINHNLAAMNANRNMNINSGAAGKSMQKLSSGLRINTAGDDAAGLAISEKMRGQIRGLDQASSNAQDGISMVQTAEGALNETTAILQRMRELAVQAGTDTNTTEDRGAIQKEVNALTSEINRIGNTTEFNTQKLINGNKTGTAAVGVDGAATLQIGANSNQQFTVDIGDMRSTKLGVAGVSGGTGIATGSSNELSDKSNLASAAAAEYALDVTSATLATAAITTISTAITTVSSERAKLGAYTNRLEHTIANLGTTSENMTSAESRIRDVDMAKEMSTFSKNNILSQAAQAMLAQANQQPQQVLQLLR
ncbi:flagellin Hag [Clostridium bowmanii]|uniref:flagellin Hag n=1 Tax=Clostridium bowmanii TaxID=132925 RepID=UPI001C0B3372|nr:flagellin Hag [Clostridium bowmanii]MBU3190702.1 flagellin Hag [Clostridium bowmanii]MCA1075052.1 flagellin Hag [Clostridium bowmanii]